MPRPKNIHEIHCPVCGVIFSVPAWRLNESLKRGQKKVCGKKCRDKMIGEINSIRRKLPQEGFQKGHRHGVGRKNKNWKGDLVGYDALHDWVRRNLGAPQKCEDCGITKPPDGCGKKKDYFEWANKSKKYKREKTDWLRLCAKCHKKYDRHGRVKAVGAHKRKIARIL